MESSWYQEAFGIEVGTSAGLDRLQEETIELSCFSTSFLTEHKDGKVTNSGVKQTWPWIPTLWPTIQLHDWVWPDLCSILNALLCLWDEDVNIGLLRWRLCSTMLLEFQMLNTWTSLPARKAGTMLSQVDSLPNLRHDFAISSALGLQRKTSTAFPYYFPKELLCSLAFI